jgi:hypothetical protein
MVRFIMEGKGGQEMRVITLFAFFVIFGLQSMGQQELGSTSATMSIPTGSDRTQEIRAQNNPIVKLYADQIKILKLGSVDFLNKLDVYQKVYLRAPKGTTPVSSLRVSDLSSGAPSPLTAQEPPILKSARELLIAYGVAEQQNIRINELIKERGKTPGLVEAVASIMATEKSGKRNIIAPDVKDSAVDSIMAACKELSFNCQTIEK